MTSMIGVSNQPQRWPTSAGAIAIAKPIADGDQREHDVLAQRRPEHVCPSCRANQSEQKGAFCTHAARAPRRRSRGSPGRAARDSTRVRRAASRLRPREPRRPISARCVERTAPSRLRRPRRRPRAARRRRVEHASTARRAALRLGSAPRCRRSRRLSPCGGVAARAPPSVVSDRRLSPRSAPTNRATNSSAGRARISSGVSYCASTPPSRRIAMRSPILIASSMSCVTNTTVLRTSRCRRRNSSCRRVAGDRVDRAEGLVHQHQRRVGGERPGHADALALAAGELRRVAVADRRRGRGRPARAARARARDPLPSPSRAAAARWRCCPRRHVREQADLLDHVADLAPQLAPARASGRCARRSGCRRR